MKESNAYTIVYNKVHYPSIRVAARYANIKADTLGKSIRRSLEKQPTLRTLSVEVQGLHFKVSVFKSY